MSPSASISRVPAQPNSVAMPVARQDHTSSGPDAVAAADTIDRAFHAAMARFTGGLSPAALALAFADWQLHLLTSPGKQATLAGQALQTAFGFVDAVVPRHAAF